MSIENIKSNFVSANLASGGAKRVLNLGQVLFADAALHSSQVFIPVGASIPDSLVIEGDFRNFIAGAGGSGMNSGPLYGEFTAVSGGVFAANVAVNLDQITRIDASGAYFFNKYGTIAAFTYTFLESIEDILGGMGHSIQDVGIFKLTQTGNTIDPPVQAAASTSTTDGTIPDGPYYAKITAYNANGETIGSNEVTVTAAGGGTSTLTFNWAPSVGAAGYKVYVGTTPDGEDSFFDVVTDLTITVLSLPGTAGLVPSSNTATDTSLNTQEYVNVKNVAYQIASGTNWITEFTDNSSVLYVENIMDVVGSGP